MIRSVIGAFAAVAAVALFAQEAAPAKSSAKAPVRNAQERMMRMTGGKVVKPGTGKGAIAVINAQTNVADVILRRALRSVTRSLRVDIQVRKGELTGLPNRETVRKTGAQIAIFVVDDERSENRVLVAPEEMWAVVNVAALRKDGPDAGKLNERTGKELMRAFGWIAGAANSNMKGSVMGPMTNNEDLDNVLIGDYPLDLYQPTLRYLKAYGIEPYVEINYRRAVQEGWAPTPTNEYQKAIWEKVHAPPEKPLKITYDKDKQKPVVK